MSSGHIPSLAGESYDITVTSQPGPSSTCADAVKFVFASAIGMPPTANDDAYFTDEDTALTVAAPGVLGNDTDPENNALKAVLSSTVSHGSLTLNADGSFLYVPAADFFGSDSFTYVANDGQFNSGVATVTITVNPVNDPPVAANDTAQTPIDTAITINVLANDTDRDGSIDPATCAVSVAPANGSAVPQGDGTVLYTPNTGYSGPDTFTYTVRDNEGASSNAATVTMTVGVVNVTPRAYNDSADTVVNLPVTINVLANDTDSDGTIDPASCTLVLSPSNGTAAVQPNGTFLYSPNPGYSGKDTFTYTVRDNGGMVSNAATVTVTVGIVIDNGAPGTSSTGSWSASSAADSYGREFALEQRRLDLHLVVHPGRHRSL